MSESQEKSVIQSKQNKLEKIPKTLPVPKQNVKIFYGLPCYGGQCFVNFAVSLFSSISLLKQYGIDSTPCFIMGESLITRARSNIVAKFYNDPDATHLLFIDSDISFEPQSVLKLLKADKQIVGGIYGLKAYKWENLGKLDEILERHKDPLHKNVSKEDFIRQNLIKYNLNYKYAQFKVVNNLVEVKHIATGFMMIKRDVITTMIEKLPHLKFWDDMGCLNKDEDRYAYTFFDCATIDGHYYSEDWLFCHRWTELGGDIWADVSIDLTHIGTHQFAGRYLSSLSLRS